MTKVVVVAGIALLAGSALVACEPADDLATPSAVDDVAADVPVPDVAEVERRARQPARDWHRRSRLVEVTVVLGTDGRWVESRATYLAPDADRMLVVTVAPGGLTSQQPTLATLGFTPPTREGLEQVPAAPSEVVEPLAAAEAAVSSGCVEQVGEVLYATGAPAGWNGGGWTSPPGWRVSAVGEGGGVRLTTDGSIPDEACFDVP